MLMQVQNRAVGKPLGDGATPGALGGAHGEAIVSGLHGKYYTQAMNGNLYWAGSDGAGVVFSIYSNASFTGGLIWNPAGSGVNLSMVRASVGVAANAATAISGFGYSWQDAGTGLATAAPVSAITLLDADQRGSCVLTEAGGAEGSKAIVGEAATFTAAMGNYRQGTFATGTGAITTETGFQLFEDFDGTMIIPPGIIMGLSSGILTGITGQFSMIWEEILI